MTPCDDGTDDQISLGERLPLNEVRWYAADEHGGLRLPS